MDKVPLTKTTLPSIRFNFEHKNAVMIELSDLDSFNDLDKM